MSEWNFLREFKLQKYQDKLFIKKSAMWIEAVFKAELSQLLLLLQWFNKACSEITNNNLFLIFWGQLKWLSGLKGKR